MQQQDEVQLRMIQKEGANAKCSSAITSASSSSAAVVAHVTCSCSSKLHELKEKHGELQASYNALLHSWKIVVEALHSTQQ